MALNNERVIECLNQVERNAGAIYVREQLDGEWRNVSLIELPTHLAIKHTCRIVRKMVFLEERREMRSVTVYMSTSTLENAIETLLNAGCFETREKAVENAAKRLEHVFPVEVTEEFHPA